MLPDAARMRRRSEFTSAVRRGRRAGAETLVVHLSRSDAAGSPTVGFIIPRGVGGAVTRNTVRRRLRHLCRDRLPSLPVGTQLVVRALPAAAAVTSSRLGRDLDGALGRVTRPANG